jgi:hypothetical protein
MYFGVGCPLGWAPKAGATEPTKIMSKWFKERNDSRKLERI